MLRLLLFCAVFCLPITALAELEVDRRVDPHKLVIAQYKAAQTESIEHDLLWTVPDDIDAIEVDNRLIMTGPPRPAPYAIELIAHTKEFETIRLEDGTERRVIINANIRRFRQTFTIAEQQPRPPDNDDDDDDGDDDKPIPDGTLGLIKRSHDWVLFVPQPFRSNHLEAIIANFDKASKSSAAPSVMLNQLTLDNRAILPDPSPERTAWLRFFEPWANYMSQLAQEGKLANTTTAHQRAFTETVDGLKHARGK